MWFIFLSNICFATEVEETFEQQICREFIEHARQVTIANRNIHEEDANIANLVWWRAPCVDWLYPIKCQVDETRTYCLPHACNGYVGYLQLDGKNRFYNCETNQYELQLQVFLGLTLVAIWAIVVLFGILLSCFEHQHHREKISENNNIRRRKHSSFMSGLHDF